MRPLRPENAVLSCNVFVYNGLCRWRDTFFTRIDTKKVSPKISPDIWGKKGLQTNKLTWQAGSKNRAGRWRKKYNGKVYYFNGGRGKSDRNAYAAAISEWNQIKLRVDAVLPRRHQAEYDSLIETWDRVLTWSNRHGETQMAQIAYEKLIKLRSALEAPVLKSPKREDYLESEFTVPTIDLPENLLEQTAKELKTDNFVFPSLSDSTIESRKKYALELDGSPQRILREIWLDRLDSVRKQSVNSQDLLSENIAEFIKHKKQEVDSNRLSLFRFYTLELHLSHFQQTIDGNISISEINTKLLLKYQSVLLENIKNGKWSNTTARGYLHSMKSFVRWLWHIEAIPNLPRVLDGRVDILSIRSGPMNIIEFTDDEIAVLLNKSKGRTKLFILLMLNCGMTQKDISDLRKNEVDLSAGRIIRKRSKTSHHEGVPTVNYLLWPETLKLLRKYQNDSESERFLLNNKGAPLLSESINKNQKYQKSDNIKCVFDRFRKKVGINKPLKSLKKTSASRLRNNVSYNSLVDLYLGHAPQSMSERHYATHPQELFDSAISWLAAEFKLDPPIMKTSSGKSKL
ncbi:MAG TPA: hypothetical protein DIT97_11515 [Gimesia maris]|uniref:Tyr recombinase domain-containing protein n=1 Tax=Gimesia maris TaxID=122 RepID=A0A3D3R495_9PLAN|nr:hypothetical protein [Gimesia maris]